MKRYIRHTSWLLLERVLRLGLGALINILIARQLGPGGFGHLSAAQAIIGLVSPFAALGFDALVVKWLLAQKSTAGQLISTLLVVRMVAAAVSVVGLLAVSAWLPNPESGLVVVLSFTLIFQGYTTLDQFFQSRIQGRISASSQLIALTLCGVLKLLLIYWHASVYWFAGAILLEALITALLMIRAFVALRDRPLLARPDYRVAKEKLAESAPLILATAVSTIFVSIDQLMLRVLAGAAAVGIFAAAARLTEAWYAVLTVLASSIFPMIVQHALEKNDNSSDRQMLLFYELSTGLSLIVALPVSFFSQPIINFLYGTKFEHSAAVLLIHIWAGVFIGWRLLSGKWMLAVGLVRLSVYRSIWGTMFNFCLAWILIPKLGVVGSALASLVSHAVVGWAADWINPLTRTQARLKARSFRFYEIRNILAKRFTATA